tara:strand:- start:278 stop:799 length:522 start_codon:yes stop_codon:yes gene_type:complete
MIGTIMALQFGAQIVGGAARATNAYQMAGKQIPLINQTMAGLESSKEEVSDIAQIERDIARTVRREDREFASEGVSFQKLDLTKSLFSNLNKQGFATSGNLQDTYQSGIDRLNLTSDKTVTGIDRKFGTQLVKIDESEATKLAEIDKSLQDLALQKAQLQQSRTATGFIGNML